MSGTGNDNDNDKEWTASRKLKVTISKEEVIPENEIEDKDDEEGE